MKKKCLLAFALCAAMLLGLAGCGGGQVVAVDETKKLPTGVIDGSQTYVDNEDDPSDDMGDMPGIDGLIDDSIPSDDSLPGVNDDVNHPEENLGDDGLDEDETETGEDESSDPVSVGSDTGGFQVSTPGTEGDDPGSSTVNRPSSNQGTSGSSGTYRFQRYVLAGASEGNFVFSGEAIMKAVNMWSEMILDPDHRTINTYLARDYLSYEDHGGLELISRIWVDDPLDTGNGAERLKSLFWQMDMSAETATADKDEWVASKTYDYILSTPAEYSEKTKIDLMCVPFLSDTWKAGTLRYDTRVRAFNNLDGTETRTYMCWDEGLTYWDMGNAMAYCMYLSGGHYAMFIVPNEGVDMAKVDVSGLMSGKIESKKAHVAFFVPSFTTESEHTLDLGDFGLSVGRVATNIVANLSKTFEPVLTQQTKFSLTPYGIGPIPSSESRPEQVLAPSEDDFSDGLDFVRIVCDRPFMYYVGDAWNEDIAFFGVMNTLPADQAVSLS